MRDGGSPAVGAGARLPENSLPLRMRRLHSGTKTVRLEGDVNERVGDEKRDDERFSAAIERLIDDHSLVEIAGGLSEEEAAAIQARIDEPARPTPRTWPTGPSELGQQVR